MFTQILLQPQKINLHNAICGLMFLDYVSYHPLLSNFASKEYLRFRPVKGLQDIIELNDRFAFSCRHNCKAWVVTIATCLLNHWGLNTCA